MLIYTIIMPIHIHSIKKFLLNICQMSSSEANTCGLMKPAGSWRRHATNKSFYKLQVQWRKLRQDKRITYCLKEFLSVWMRLTIKQSKGVTKVRLYNTLKSG